MDPEISIVIPTHDRCQMLLSVLDALGRQTLDPQRYEVIVVADGCQDDTASAIKGLITPFHLILVEQPDSGPGVARNLGAKSASSPLLLFLDDDIEPEPELVEVHLDSLKKWPGAVILGYSPFSDELDQYDFPNLELRDFWDSIFANQASTTYRFSFRDLITANISIPIKLFEDIGGFDKKLSKLTCEDTELGLRLIKQQVRFRFAGKAVGKHHAKRPLQNNLQRKFNQGRAHIIIIQKHPETIFSFLFGYIYKNEISNMALSSNSLLITLRRLLFKLVWLNSIFADILDLVLQLFLYLSSLFKNYKLYKFFLTKLYNYKYLRGVQRELNSLAAAKQLAEDALNTPIYFNEAYIDLKTEFSHLGEILSKQPVDGARLAYGDLKIGQIEPIVGAEALRPSHIYQAIYNSIINPNYNTFNNNQLVSLLQPFFNELSGTLLFDQSLTIDQGWFEPENWTGIKTRSMMNKAILPIYSKKTCIVKIDLRAASCYNSKTLEIRLEDHLVGKWIVPTEFINITAEIPLSMGLNILWLHAIERCDSQKDHWISSSLLNPDSRRSRIVFQNIAIIPRVEQI